MLEGPFGTKQEILFMIREAGLKVEDLDKKKKVEGKRRRGAQLEALWIMETEGITFEEMKNFTGSDIVYPKSRPKNYYKDYLLPAMKKHEEEMKKQPPEISKQEEEEFSKKRDEFMKKLEENYPRKTLPKDSSSDSSSVSSDTEDDDDSEDEDDSEVEDDSDYEEKMCDGVPNKRLRHVPTPDEGDVDLDDPDYDEMSAIFKKLDEEEAKRLRRVPNRRRPRYVSTPPLATTSAAAGDDGMQQMACDVSAAAATGDCTAITALWLSKKRRI